jgi:hypothetical protein
LTDDDHHAQALTAMVVRVREALVVARWGMPDVYYTRTIHRLRLAGRALQARDLSVCLPALGIPSDLSLIFDGVSVGAEQFLRNESLMLLGVAFEVAACSVFPRAGPRIQVRMLGAPSSGQHHDGEGQKATVLEALADHPEGFR